MNNEGIILVGAGGHAISCIDAIEAQNKYQILGLVGLPKEIGTEILGYKVISADDGLGELSLNCPNALITLGSIKSPKRRIDLYEKLITFGFNLPVIISPRAYVSPHAVVGFGTIVLHGAIINAGANIGNNCIINSCSLVEHGALVGSHVHLSTGAILNGDVRVGLGSYIGSGCAIKEGVSIGEGCLVAMGLTVRHDLPDDSYFLGSKN